jgi:hypothetical protein
MGWIGGRSEALPQPTIEQMMRGVPVKGVAVSADILHAQRRMDEGTRGSVDTPWVADSSEEEDDWEAHAEHEVITQEAPGLGDAHADTAPAAPVRDATPAAAAVLMLPLLLPLLLLLLLLLLMMMSLYCCCLH